MRRLLAYGVLACVVGLGAAGLAAQNQPAAQDVAITNARIIVGNGQVIESGTIVVRGGKIASVAAGAAPTQGLKVIDAKGMSAMPGFIDGHKHVNNYDAAQIARMSPMARIAIQFFSAVPMLRRMGRLLRYRFKQT